MTTGGAVPETELRGGPGARPHAAALGRRGQETRRRLLDALSRLLEENPPAWISVADIARTSALSPATFYRYFGDVDEAALALAVDLVDDLDPAVRLVGRPWAGPEGLPNVTAFVEAFLAHWGRHGAVLRLRNLASEQGDQRFSDVRMQTLRPLNRALATKIRERQRVDPTAPPLHPTIAATALVGMLERIGAHRANYERRGYEALVRTTALIIQQSVCGG